MEENYDINADCPLRETLQEPRLWYTHPSVYNEKGIEQVKGCSEAKRTLTRGATIIPKGKRSEWIAHELDFTPYGMNRSNECQSGYDIDMSEEESETKTTGVRSFPDKVGISEIIEEIEPKGETKEKLNDEKRESKETGKSNTSDYSNTILYEDGLNKKEESQCKRGKPTVCCPSEIEETCAFDFENMNGLPNYACRPTKKKRKRESYLKRASAKVTDVNYLTKDGTARGSTEERNLPPDKGLDTTKWSTPLLYCKFVARFPVLSFVLSSTLHIGTIITTIALVLKGSNVFPVEFNSLPLTLHHHTSNTRDLAWRFRNDFKNRVVRPVYDYYYPYWMNGQLGDILEVFLETHHGDVFSETNLKLLQTVENRLFNFQDYTRVYCQRDYWDTCKKPLSVLRLFDGTYEYIDNAFQPQSFGNKQVLCDAMKFNETREYLRYFLEKNYDPCEKSTPSSKTRLFFLLGYPLIGGNSDSRIESYLINQLKPNLEDMQDGFLKDKMNLYYISEKMFNYDSTQQAFKDMKLAIGSFLFIFAFMWFQSASFFVTFLAIISIITSYLLTNLIYRYAFGYEYFGFFHIIAMFIILGIGADDVFVFYDTWRLSSNKDFPSKAHRLSECYRNAAKTTFVTSLTTMTAFLVSAFSPLLAVKTFGLFSGILVAVNYICDLIYFPTAIMLYSEKIKPMTKKLHEKLCSSLCCCLPCAFRKSCSPQVNASKSFLCNPRNTAADDSRRLYGNTNNDKIAGSTISFDSNLSTDQSSTNSRTELCKETNQRCSKDVVVEKSEIKKKIKKNTKDRKHFQDRNRIVVFLRNGFSDFVTLRVVRFAIPIIFIGISTFFVYEATLLEPDSKQVQIYRSSHNYGKANLLHYYGFQRNFDEEYTSLYLVWGPKPKDISSCNLKSTEYCQGTTVWDKNFIPSNPDAQQALHRLCQRLEAMTSEEAYSLRIRRNAQSDRLAVDCLMTSMERYLQEDVAEQKYNGRYPQDLYMDIPLEGANVSQFMSSNSYIYHSHSLPNDYTRFLEIGVGYWLTNKYSNIPHEDYFRFDPLLGEEWIPGETQQARNAFLASYYGTKLRYVGIRVNLTISVYTLGYAEGKPIYDRWEKFMQEELEKMPSSMKSGFQCTTSTWHWIMVQQVLAESAIKGSIIGLCCACPILIITTQNVVIGIIATVYISLVTTCVVGIIPLAGWKLGVLESLNLCMVVGLSIDYVVHLAEAYRTSPYPDRMSRVKTMFEKMGLSVLSGAITTFGASIFLLFAQIQFLYEFGIFVMATVSISLLFSFTFFPALMSICGPQGNTGCLVTLIKKILARCKVKDTVDNSSHVESPGENNPTRT